MKFTRIAILLSVLIFRVLAVPDAHADLIPSADGQTVYDTLLQVNWLADANLAGAKGGTGQFGVANISQYGSMDFSTAKSWVKALNSYVNPDKKIGYLHHKDWSLPTSPWAFPNPPQLKKPPYSYDPSCSATGPHGASFGYGCMNSALGSLFYQPESLHLRRRDTAVPIPFNRVGPFVNFQPYLYWSCTNKTTGTCPTGVITGKGKNGYQTFSFNTGWEGSNVNAHYMYVLPMIPGRLPCTVDPLPPHHVHCPRYFPTGYGDLEISEDGQTVFDPDAVDPVTGVQGVTWLADANLAATQQFGAQCVNRDGTKCINRDGSMSHTTALNWISGMNGTGWLGQTNWQLPPTDTNDLCGEPQGQQPSNLPNFNCTGSPMGELFYNQLGFSQGNPVVPTPDVNVGPFKNVQPYLYWSCTAAQPPDRQTTCDYKTPPNTGYEWSFSFGNGFQGTDVVGNHLYVMVYYYETTADRLAEAITTALGTTSPNLNQFLSQATAISSAPNASAKAQALGTFISLVDGQLGVTLTTAQADELIALAQAI